MIKNKEKFKQFENDFNRAEGKMPYLKALKIFESMWKEGCSLGALPPVNPIEGIETDIKIAKALNSCLKNSFPG